MQKEPPSAVWSATLFTSNTPSWSGSTKQLTLQSSLSRRAGQPLPTPFSIPNRTDRWEWPCSERYHPASRTQEHSSSPSLPTQTTTAAFWSRSSRPSYRNTAISDKYFVSTALAPTRQRKAKSSSETSSHRYRYLWCRASSTVSRRAIALQFTFHSSEQITKFLHTVIFLPLNFVFLPVFLIIMRQNLDNCR